jgi:hypothetical protein
MTISIFGAGLIGTAIARRLARANIRAILSNSRGPKAAAVLSLTLAGPSGLGHETKQPAGAVIVAVTWSKLPPDFGGRIVIDANNMAGCMWESASWCCRARREDRPIEHDSGRIDGAGSAARAHALFGVFLSVEPIENNIRHIELASRLSRTNSE